MASFYIHDGAQALTLQITGELTQGAALELEQTWLTARSTLAGRQLLIVAGNEIVFAQLLSFYAFLFFYCFFKLVFKQ